MLASLADNFAQPVAIFASKGPIKGKLSKFNTIQLIDYFKLVLDIDLTKLVIKAIMLLEESGAEVMGLTTDGASFNRTMWSQLGINGKMGQLNNYFLNLFDNHRKVFVFSDAPHLIKTIRNRLHDKKF